MSKLRTDQLRLHRLLTIDLVVDIWRIDRRARRDANTPSGVRLACEAALDRVADLGFAIEEPVGQPYHENARMRVVDDGGVVGRRRIAECLSPAVYFNGDLIKPAEVTLERDETDGETDS